MNIRLIRHATLVLEAGAGKYLVDPMFGPAEARDPVSNSPNPGRNPMVEIPIQQDQAGVQLLRFTIHCIMSKANPINNSGASPPPRHSR